jgi:hypothetical protein
MCKDKDPLYFKLNRHESVYDQNFILFYLTVYIILYDKYIVTKFKNFKWRNIIKQNKLLTIISL